MKKYFTKDSHKEVNFGDMRVLIKKMETPLGIVGIGECVVKMTITEVNIEELVKEGVVAAEEVKAEKKAEPKKEVTSVKEAIRALKPVYKGFARKYSLPAKDTVTLFAFLHRTSPLKHLNLLIETIVEMKNKGLTKGKYAYCLAPPQGYTVTEVALKSNCLPEFYKKEDAVEAYKLLLPFIKQVRGGE